MVTRRYREGSVLPGKILMSVSCAQQEVTYMAGLECVCGEGGGAQGGMVVGTRIRISTTQLSAGAARDNSPQERLMERAHTRVAVRQG